MLVPAPYKAPEKKATKKAKGAKSGRCRKGTPDVTFEDDEVHSSVLKDNGEEEEEEEEESNPPPEERKKKRAASAHPEADTPKKGKSVPAVNTAWDVDSSPERRPRTKPPAAS